MSAQTYALRSFSAAQAQPQDRWGFAWAPNNSLGLSSTEGEVIGALGDGQALWRVAGRSFLVQHVLSDMEWALVETDAAMLEIPDREVLDRQVADETEEARV